ncbi:MAG: AzlC family ABC transporter permease [Clostridia bacterium]
MIKQDYIKGVKSGLSIGLGYFSVSFSFGILAVGGGLSVFNATLISMITVTSAGQFAGLESIIASSSIVAMAMTQVVINMRYALMSLALSQKLKPNTNTFKRCLIAFFNTDEIFAVAMGNDGYLSLAYMLGLALLPWLGWTSGTLCGAIAGEILPASVSSALGVALYAMFIAIVVPSFKAFKPVRFVVVIAAVLSCIIFFVPFLKTFSIIICTIVASALGAWLFPINESKKEEQEL